MHWVHILHEILKLLKRFWVLLVRCNFSLFLTHYQYITVVLLFIYFPLEAWHFNKFWGKLLLKVIHYNIALLHIKWTLLLQWFLSLGVSMLFSNKKKEELSCFFGNYKDTFKSKGKLINLSLLYFYQFIYSASALILDFSQNGDRRYVN